MPLPSSDKLFSDLYDNDNSTDDDREAESLIFGLHKSDGSIWGIKADTIGKSNTTRHVQIRGPSVEFPEAIHQI